MSAKLLAAQLNAELRDWATLERSCADDAGARKVWADVEAWADGIAAKYGLTLNNEQRLTRQGRFFNHGGQCGKIVTGARRADSKLPEVGKS